MSTGRPRGSRFPRMVIQHAVWLYARFTPSPRDVEEPLAERGVTVTYETARAWVARSGPAIARGLRAWRGHGSSGRWHLDEVFVSVGGRRMYLWRAVDGEGEVLDVLVQARRDKAALLRLMRRLLKRHGTGPEVLITDGLGSYAAAAHEPGLSAVHVRARSANSRAEGSHVPIRPRGRRMQGRASEGRARRSVSSPSTPPSPPPATSSPPPPTASSAQRHSPRGATPSPAPRDSKARQTAIALTRLT